MSEIRLHNGMVALVDEEDYEQLGKHKWTAIQTTGGYWRATRKENYKRIYMDRFLLDIVNEPKLQADHINGDTLDNRRCNLRVATRAENRRNRHKRVGSSRYLGVAAHAGKWEARIQHDNASVYIGLYETQEQAAGAYDTMAKLLHGEFANLNFKEVV